MGFALGAADYLTKPIDRDAPAAVLERLRSAPSHVLVVEDDPASREMLGRMLGKRGFRSEEAGNGREALSAARAGTRRVILLDLMMPEMDGFEFVTELRRREEWRKHSDRRG